MKPHRGTTILTVGILGLAICPALGIAAWLMGNKDLREMKAGLMDPSGRGATSAGRNCGMIGFFLMILAIVLLIAVSIMLPAHWT